jgi:hypothetical protein
MRGSDPCCVCCVFCCGELVCRTGAFASFFVVCPICVTLGIIATPFTLGYDACNACVSGPNRETMDMSDASVYTDLQNNDVVKMD